MSTSLRRGSSTGSPLLTWSGDITSPSPKSSDRISLEISLPSMLMPWKVSTWRRSADSSVRTGRALNILQAGVCVEPLEQH